MPDLGRRHQLEHGVDHAQAGAQNRHQADANAQLVGVDALQWRVDLDRPDLHIRQRLVAEQPGEFANNLAELLGLGPLVAQNCELVEDRRVPRDVERRPRGFANRQWRAIGHERLLLVGGYARGCRRYCVNPTSTGRVVPGRRLSLGVETLPRRAGVWHEGRRWTPAVRRDPGPERGPNPPTTALRATGAWRS